MAFECRPWSLPYCHIGTSILAPALARKGSFTLQQFCCNQQLTQCVAVKIENIPINCNALHYLSPWLQQNCCSVIEPGQRKLNVGVRTADVLTTGLQFNWNGFDQIETTESKPFKLETSRTVILPLTVSVLCRGQLLMWWSSGQHSSSNPTDLNLQFFLKNYVWKIRYQMKKKTILKQKGCQWPNSKRRTLDPPNA